MKIIKKLTALVLFFIVLTVGIYIFAYPIDDSKYSINGNLVEQISSTVPNYTEIDKIPQDLKNAVVAVEDKRFYDHHGVDIIGIGRAFFNNIKEKEIKEGGSTITQQLAKNLFLTQDKSFARKVNEMILALKIESKYSKDKILEMYLNVIYYGAGSYGVQDASRTYFNKDVWDISPAQCTLLAGLPQAPSIYNPKKYFDRAKNRQIEVIAAMAEVGYSKEELEKIKNEKITIID